MNDIYDGKEVASLLGMSYRQLNGWLKAGIVSCDTPAEGTGTGRLFTFRDVVLAALAKDLANQRIPLETVGQAVASARASWMDGQPESAGQLLMFMGTSPVLKWCPLGSNADWTTHLGSFFSSAEMEEVADDSTPAVYTQINLVELARSVSDLMASQPQPPVSDLPVETELA